MIMWQTVAFLLGYLVHVHLVNSHYADKIFLLEVGKYFSSKAINCPSRMKGLYT